jgi:hypothetical protein
MCSRSVGCGMASRTQSATQSAKFYSRSHNAVIRVYDDAGNVIETHEHAGDFKLWRAALFYITFNARDQVAFSACPVAAFAGLLCSWQRLALPRARPSLSLSPMQTHRHPSASVPPNNRLVATRASVAPILNRSGVRVPRPKRLASLKDTSMEVHNARHL